MGKLMLNNINYTGGSGGTNVVPNPPETATDDLTSVKIDNTVYNLAGGGNVYGAFIDTSRVLYSQNEISSVDYTAVEDCYVMLNLESKNTGSAWAYIDGELVGRVYGTQGETLGTVGIYLKRGQRVTTTNTGSIGQYIRVYGLTFGTQNIFTPIIYSTEERCVGIWKDNKPLYAKTINITAYPSNTTAVDIPHGIADIDTVAHFEAHARWSNGAMVIIPNAQVNNGSIIDSASFDCNVNKTNITLRVGTNRSSISGEVTILYTKTTDTAGSGQYNTLGVPMVHIEDNVETVIGTYNGKPLYQKCYALINPTAGAFDTLSSIEDVIKISGTFKRTSTGIWYELDGRTESNNYNVYYVRVQIDTSDNVILAYDGYSQSDIEKVRCTIQYTKTTD